MKILLFDDHQLFSKSLEIVLAQHVDVFKSFETPENIIAILDQENPDIVILDVHMGQYSGLELGRQVLQERPETKLVFLSGYNLHEYNLEAQRMGAKGFLEKNLSVEMLVDNIQRIHQGQTIFMADDEAVLGELTQREKEILQYASNGDTQQVIADTLKISRRTVNNHLLAINEKLMVNSTVAAIVKGIELGIVKLPNNR